MELIADVKIWVTTLTSADEPDHLIESFPGARHTLHSIVNIVFQHFHWNKDDHADETEGKVPQAAMQKMVETITY